MSDNSKKIIERIKKEGIKPIPKSYFRLKNGLLWVLFVLGIFVGAMAFSVILFTIQQVDFDLVAHMQHSRLEFVLGLLPLFWLSLLIVFIVVAIVGIKNSRKGYKFTFLQLVGFNVALSVLVGTLLFIGSDMARKLERAFAIRVSLYESIEEKKTRIWSMPEQGYLSGVILRTDGDTLLILDAQKEEWKILYEGAFVPPVVSLEAGEQVKFVGEMLSRGLFKAEEIRPWGGQKMMKKMRAKRQEEQGKRK